jgi:hypothetical protein
MRGIQRQQKNGNLLLITTFVIVGNLGNRNLTTDDNLLTADTYVWYRSQHPDKETVNDVLKKLKENNIDVGQLQEYRTNPCQ